MSDDVLTDSRFIEVTKSKFMGVIYHHRLNVHPSPNKYDTEWKDLTDRTTFAKTTHGWLTNTYDPKTPPERFFISRKYARLIESAPDYKPKGEQQ